MTETAPAGVDAQVMLEAKSLTDDQKRNPEWLWYNHDHGPGDHPLSFGRWPSVAGMAPYVRADLIAAPALPTAEADELRAAHSLKDLVWTYMPSYGELSFDQLREAVSEANIGYRDRLGPFDPTYYPGHQQVGGCNYNSLNRIVTAFVRAALATTPETAKLDTSAADGLQRPIRFEDKERNKIINRASTDLEKIVNGHDPEVYHLGNRVWDRLDKMALEIEAHAALHPAPTPASSGGMATPVAFTSEGQLSVVAQGGTGVIYRTQDEFLPVALYPASTIEALSKQVADLTKERDAEAKSAEYWKGLDAIHHGAMVGGQNRIASLEAALADQSRRADEAAQAERDRLYELAVAYRNHGCSHMPADFLSTKDAMLPVDRAARAALREQKDASHE